MVATFDWMVIRPQTIEANPLQVCFVCRDRYTDMAMVYSADEAAASVTQCFRIGNLSLPTDRNTHR